MRIERKADDLMGDAEKDGDKRGRGRAPKKKAGRGGCSIKEGDSEEVLVRRRLAHERDHFAKEQAAMLAAEKVTLRAQEGPAPEMLKVPAAGR